MLSSADYHWGFEIQRLSSITGIDRPADIQCTELCAIFYNVATLLFQSPQEGKKQDDKAKKGKLCGTLFPSDSAHRKGEGVIGLHAVPVGTCWEAGESSTSSSSPRITGYVAPGARPGLLWPLRMRIWSLLTCPLFLSCRLRRCCYAH